MDNLIYLSGGMQNFGSKDFNKSNNWRVDIKNWIVEITDNKWTAFNPNEHWNFVDEYEDFDDLESMKLDLFKLKKSDLVIYNNNDPFSRGSMAEIAIAYDHGIPVLLLNEENNEIHPWQKAMSERIFTDREDLMLYILNHYLRRD